LAIVVLLSFARLCRILPDPGDISSNILEKNAIRPASSHALTVQNEVAGSRRPANWYGRAPATPEDREFAPRAVYHHFPDQEVLDGLHEELRQHREHFVWLESEGHSSSRAAAGLRKKIEQLEEQIETLRATGRFP
jgi:hypothetical protein